MRSNKPLALFKIWDILLIALLLALVGLTLYFALSPEEGTFAEIYLDGKLYRTVSLKEDCTVELVGLKVVVSDGKVRVEEATCPDKLCEKRGAISRAGESIVCLPARVVVKIAGKGEVEAIT